MKTFLTALALLLIGTATTNAQSSGGTNAPYVQSRFTFDGNFYYTYTVPATGTYLLETKGAQGGPSNGLSGGRGSWMRGYFQLQAGDVLRIGVGEMGKEGLGTIGNNYSGGGGGGASSIVLVQGIFQHIPLLFAGGGGGAGTLNGGVAGQTGLDGASGNTPSGNAAGAGGINGGGGGTSSEYRGGAGGAGYYGWGGSHYEANGTTLLSRGGYSYQAGYAGGSDGTGNGASNGVGGRGGWGGGGQGGPAISGLLANDQDGGGGGGGGWSGGGGGDLTNNSGGGGGGGSYIASSASTNGLTQVGGINFGDGLVVISGPVTPVLFQGNTFNYHTIPTSGWYLLDVSGAQGGPAGSHNGGLGARMRTMVQLAAGDVLKIGIGGAGQAGQNDGNNVSGGGGGGASSVVNQTTGNTLLIMAGGGGGAGSDHEGSPGLTGHYGGTGDATFGGLNGIGGGGGGGIGSDNHGGAGGAGYIFDGGTHCSGACNGSNVLSYGGQAYLSGNYGGNSGTIGGNGGWGGGGEGGPALSNLFSHIDGGGGGGGGYSGGGGANEGNGAGGGGSYLNPNTSNINGLTQLEGVNPGDGLVAVSGPFADTDGDGFIDPADNSPTAYNPDQTDTDGDGVGDLTDGCPQNKYKIQPGICGCSTPETDANENGVTDCLEGIFTWSGPEFGFQNYVIPADGLYLVQAKGAQGGSTGSMQGGKGAFVQTYYYFHAGDTLELTPGQRGSDGSRCMSASGWNGGGGGGGTGIVFKNHSTGRLPILFAGGGGGAYAPNNYSSFPGNAADVIVYPYSVIWWDGVYYHGKPGGGYITNYLSNSNGPISGIANTNNCSFAGSGSGGWGGGGQGGMVYLQTLQTPIDGFGGGGGGYLGGFGGGSKYCEDCDGQNIIHTFRPGGGGYSYHTGYYQTLSQLDGENEGDGYIAIVGPVQDSDADSIADATDNCINTYNTNQSDLDGDGVGDVCDVCPENPEKTFSNSCGCTTPDWDTDSNGITDCNEGLFNFKGDSRTAYPYGFQQYVVPTTGWYLIEANGSQGGSAGSGRGGTGARIKGYFYLMAGDSLVPAPGCQGANGVFLDGGNNLSGGGGGGASSVFLRQSQRLLIMAGGGGGGGASYLGLDCFNYLNGNVGTDSDGAPTSAGGVNGNGGLAAAGAGGGGFIGNGQGAFANCDGGQAYLNGNTGGKYHSNSRGMGGFGGGGQGSVPYNTGDDGGGGGGGGYGGGGGGDLGGGGGGGGSYIDTMATIHGLVNLIERQFGNGSIRITPAQTVTLNLKVFIQGFYLGNGLMQAVLFDQNIVTDSTACDSVTVELHEILSPLYYGNNTHKRVSSVTSLLHTDGTAQITLPSTINGGDFHIVIKHRNSIETWSKNPVTFTSVTNVDFTSGNATPCGSYTWVDTSVSACGSYTWSANGITYTQSGTDTSVSGCVITVLILTINPATSNTTTATACDSYTWSVDGNTSPQSGSYSSVSGCNTENLSLTIIPATSNTSVTACGSYTWSVNGITYTQSGSYSSVNGCNTENLSLTIIPVTSNTTTVTACDSYAWSVDGNSYTQSGSYSSVSGCNTENLSLTIVPATSNTTTATACGSYTWSVDGNTYTQSGSYSSVSGCNTENLVLTITGNATSNTTAASACDSYNWLVNGTTYTQSGSYTSLTGCDTYVLNLTITASSSNTTTASGCGSYTWNVDGQTYTQSGSYSSVNGCHTEILALTITPLSSNTTTTTACGSYTWSVDGNTYTASGTYSSVTGCNTELLSLTINPVTSSTTTATACGSYTWSVNGVAYTLSGSYTAVSSCGTEVLNLTIEPLCDVDGNAYDTVVIGNQVWFSENLKVSKYRNGDAIPTGLSDASWQATTSGAYAIHNNTAANDSIYGKLYNWYAVADPRGLCPTGWHVPSDAEWATLENFLGGSSIAGGKMKAVSSLWGAPNTGADNSSGFTGLPGGNRDNNGTFSATGGFGFWWSSTQFSTSNSWYSILSYSSTVVNLVNFAFAAPGGGNNTYGHSVRCAKDLPPTVTTSSVTSVTPTGATCGGDVTSSGSDAVTARGVVWSTSPNPTVALTTKTTDGSGTGSFTSSITGLSPSTTYYVRAYATNSFVTGYGSESTFTTLAPGQFTDIDGNIYDTIAISTQVWMKQNLKVSKYRNGDAIPTGLSDASWQNTTSGAYAIYNNTAANDSIYGKLYNWYAVADSRGLCPTGWHVPSDAEWTTLENFLGGNSVAGGKMKATGVAGSGGLWNSPNTAADNSSGFTGLPGGYRILNGAFFYIGDHGFWWSSTQYSTTSAWYRFLGNSYAGVNQSFDTKRDGCSVRCVRD